MHADTAFDHSVEVRLDRALLDEEVTGRRANLVGRLGHCGEHATRDVGEEVDTMERGDPVDETERVAHVPWTAASSSAISSCS